MSGVLYASMDKIAAQAKEIDKRCAAPYLEWNRPAASHTEPSASDSTTR